MLASLTELKGYYVQGRDGELGRIDDLGLREDEWLVRYVVVDMEDLDRETLLLAAYLGGASRAAHTVFADIRRDQVENAPRFDRSEPLTRRDEQELHDLYGWPVYWWEQEQEITPVGELWDEPEPEPENPDEREEEGPQLLFAGDLIEVYGVQAEGEEIGRLQDVIVDGESWSIPYLVIDVPSARKRILLASDYIETIELAARSIHVTVPRDALVNGPVIAAEEPITPELEQSLKEYYDQYSC